MENKFHIKDKCYLTQELLALCLPAPTILYSPPGHGSFQSRSCSVHQWIHQCSLHTARRLTGSQLWGHSRWPWRPHNTALTAPWHCHWILTALSTNISGSILHYVTSIAGVSEIHQAAFNLFKSERHPSNNETCSFCLTGMRKVVYYKDWTDTPVYINNHGSLREIHHINIFCRKKAYEKLQNAPISLSMSLCTHVVTWEPIKSDL